MKIKDFIENGSNIEDINVKTYAPVVDKAKTINTFIESGILEEDEKDLITKYNSITVEVIRTLSALSLYTDLEMGTEKDYDLIIESGLMDKIIEAIGDDYYEYQRFFSMRLDDYIHQKNNVDSILTKIVKMIQDVNPDLIDRLLNRIK